MGLPFYKDRFFVQRIDGVTQIQKKKGDYKLSIWATHLMPYDAASNSSIQLTLDNKPAKLERVDQNQANYADIFLDNSTLEALFAPDKMTVIKGRMTITLSEEQRYLLLFHRTMTHQFSFPLNLALYPLYAGSVSVTGTVPTFDWVTITPGASTPPINTDNYDCHTRPGDNCGHPQWSPAYTGDLPR